MTVVFHHNSPSTLGKKRASSFSYRQTLLSMRVSLTWRGVLVGGHWAIAFVVACCAVALTSGMRTLLGCDMLIIVGKHDLKLPARNIPLI